MGKRGLAAVMACMMIVSATAGCSNTGTETETVHTESNEENVSQQETPLQNTEENGNAEAENKEGKIILNWLATYLDQDVVRQYADEYNQSQDEIYVEVADATFGSSTDYYEALAVNIASGDSYDLFSMSATYLDKYISSQIAYCVDDYILGNDDVKDYAQEAVIRNGHAYAFPATNDVIGLFVNLDMLEESGHTTDDLNTWGGMVEAAADISNHFGNYGCLTDLGFGGGYAEFLWYATMWGAGGNITADLDGNITVTNPEKIAAAAIAYRDLITGSGGSTEFNNDIDYFINETCGMDIIGQDGLYKVDEGNVGFEWTFVPIPPLSEGGQAYSPLGGWHIMINGKGEHAKEAAEFLNWLYFESNYVADECLANYQLSPLVSADENLDALYKDTKFSLAYELIDSGAIECRAELAFDSKVLEAIGEMLSGIIYETSTEEEAVNLVNEFISKVGAQTVEEN
ncbi:MAG TPA: extracellular solute-binding protein [Candidatus Eisenbergiella pullicola]|nr:extracellular solute-binding protein [Candidatus Eisenbergiella pullicola]